MNGRVSSRGSRVRPAKDETDWARVDATADAEIAAAVGGDPDSFVPGQDWIDNARVVVPGSKQMVTLRLDPDVLAWFRNSGRGYQTRMNAVLRAFVEAKGQGRVGRA